jgi:hypothetical protein
VPFQSYSKDFFSSLRGCALIQGDRELDSLRRFRVEVELRAGMENRGSLRSG